MNIMQQVVVLARQFTPYAGLIIFVTFVLDGIKLQQAIYHWTLNVDWDYIRKLGGGAVEHTRPPYPPR